MYEIGDSVEVNLGFRTQADNWVPGVIEPLPSRRSHGPNTIGVRLADGGLIGTMEAAVRLPTP